MLLNLLILLVGEPGWVRTTDPLIKSPGISVDFQFGLTDLDPIDAHGNLRVSEESVKLLDPLAPAHACPADGILEWHGEISATFHDTFTRDADCIKAVMLDSGGGSLAYAWPVAEQVRARDISVYVSRRCESACTAIFHAARRKYTLPTARFLYHAPAIAPEDLDDFRARCGGLVKDPGCPGRRAALLADSMAAYHTWLMKLEEIGASAALIQAIRDVRASEPWWRRGNFTGKGDLVLSGAELVKLDAAVQIIR